ncbi:hypothetical protein [Acinetobacter schindleri]|uniref:hypothetical protein n=1 Tax=Acinetobacter schindleri TaxID=108981 RepID=UPI003F568E8F
MVEFLHTTSIFAAKKIVLSKTFISHTNLDDHGLNGFNETTWSDNRHQLDGSDKHNRDATLKFVWCDQNGVDEAPFESVDFDYPVHQMKFGTLYRQGEFRIFLRAPYTGSFLRLVGIEFKHEEKLLNTFNYPYWINLIPIKRIKAKLKLKHLLIERNLFIQNYEKQNLFIKVI